jgi:hypothetical protein
MKTFLDTHCMIERCEEELVVLRREVTDSVAFCEKQLVEIDGRLKQLAGVEDCNTREWGQHLQLTRMRGEVASLRARLEKTRGQVLHDGSVPIVDEQQAGSAADVEETAGEGTDVEEDDQLFDEEDIVEEGVDSALGGSEQSDDEDWLEEDDLRCR